MTIPISISSRDIPVPANTVITFKMGVATGQSIDWPTDADVVRITPVTTAGAPICAYVNLYSTAAAIPSSGSSAGTTATAAVNIPVAVPTMFSIPSSTGMSCIANSACYVHVECWKR